MTRIPLPPTSCASAPACWINAAFIALYAPANMNFSSAAVDEINTMLAFSEFSRCGMEASISRTAPSTSYSKLARQPSSPGALPPLTFDTTQSMPPSASAEAATHALSASASPTSTDWPNAVTSFAESDSTAAETSASLRAQIATLQPSAASDSAIARPIPLLPPVISAFWPLSCRSMMSSLLLSYF